MNNEPALILGAVEAIMVLLIAFGVPITSDQKVAIIGVASAIVSLVGAVVLRSQVTPNAKVTSPNP